MFDEVFLLVKLQKCLSGFFEKREQFMDSAVAKTKRDVFILQQHFIDTAYFFQSANTLTLNTVCIKNGLLRCFIGDIIKTISVTDK